jgi:hypothetical protein
MRRNRTTGRRQVARKPPRPQRRTVPVNSLEKARRRARIADEEATRRAEASVSLVRLRATPGQGPEKIRREYAALLARMRALLKRAEDEKRALTAEEASEWDRIDAALAARRAEIKRYEKPIAAASALREKMRALLDNAQREKLDLTSKETQEWDRMEADLVARKADIATQVAIDQLASELRAPLHRIDSTRWRCPLDAVQRKIAEELFNFFILEIRPAQRWWDGVRSLQAERDAYLKAAKILTKIPRTSDEAEAAFGFHRDLPAPPNLKYQGERLNGRLNWFLQFRPRPLYCHSARYLNRLILRLTAILTHTTDLTPHYILKELLPGVLGTAWQSYSALAPRRGAADPLTRYKRDISAAKKDLARPLEQRIRLDPRATLNLSENHSLEYRTLLFKNDDRFPLSLFEPRRSTRTVDHHSPTKVRSSNRCKLR